MIVAKGRYKQQKYLSIMTNEKINIRIMKENFYVCFS